MLRRVCQQEDMDEMLAWFGDTILRVASLCILGVRESAYGTTVVHVHLCGL